MRKQIIQRLPKRIQFTKEGLAKVKTDFERYTEKRKDAVIALRTAREMGDLSENGAYKAARFQLSDIDRELGRLRFLLRFADVVEIKKTGVIDFGCRVTLSDGNKEMTFLLVSGYESDPKQQKLSVFSPLGKAIVGKKTGDTVKVVAPVGERTYKIIRFE